MIENDEYGIFFCYDALLALIPIIIILSAVTQIQFNPSDSQMEKVLFHQAQDTLDMMSVQNRPEEPSILERLSFSISNNNLESTHQIADSWLKNKLGKRKYRLIEVNHLNGREICSGGEINRAKNVAVAVKCQDQYIYMLYLGS